MDFITAQKIHLNQICRIMDEGKAQLKKLGLNQWQNGYPSREVFSNDIDNGIDWIVADGDDVKGVFAFFTDPEESYDNIEGNWLTGSENRNYSSLHRVCVADNCKGQGVAGILFRNAIDLSREKGMTSVRIDTHPGNKPMQSALKKAGFTECGTIYLASGTEAGDARLAFEFVL